MCVARLGSLARIVFQHTSNNAASNPIQTHVREAHKAAHGGYMARSGSCALFPQHLADQMTT